MFFCFYKIIFTSVDLLKHNDEEKQLFKQSNRNQMCEVQTHIGNSSLYFICIFRHLTHLVFNLDILQKKKRVNKFFFTIKNCLESC